MPSCPCCGSKLPKPPRDDGLSDQQRTILDSLMNSPGSYVAVDKLISDMYWDDTEPENARAVLTMQIMRMRRKGFDIENGYGKYRISNVERR
jgi:DNA-binding response OmpR family regulator